MFFLKNKSLQVLLIILVALVYRLPGLSERPMHSDEAVNAVKFSQLIESQKFVYNPVEYHGPALFYFTLPVAWITGNMSFKKFTETMLRMVPVIFGTALIALLFLLGSGVRWHVLCIAAFFTAISPAFVYYSRYYIHEMLFVFFCYLTVFSAYRYCRDQKIHWLLLSAFSLGLMISTKETWIIIVLMMVISASLTFVPFKKQRVILTGFIKSVPLNHILGFWALFFLIVILFYTSFFKHPQGLVDSFSAFSTYFQRAGNNQIHVHPWYMYFKWLLFFGMDNGHFWSEAIIALFALIGITGIIANNKFREGENTFLLFLLIFVLTTSITFSLIPYKTPWNLLTFWYGFMILGSVGFFYIYSKLINKLWKRIYILITSLFVLHLGWQSYQLNFNLASSVGNPYVYAHPVEDVIRVSEKFKHIAEQLPDGYNAYIQVFAKDNDYWPLPWYLRRFDRVAWWNSFDSVTAAAPIIIAQAAMEDQLIYQLYQKPPPGKRNLYLPLFQAYTELRPGVEIRGYIRKDISDMLNSSTEEPIDFNHQ